MFSKIINLIALVYSSPVSSEEEKSLILYRVDAEIDGEQSGTFFIYNSSKGRKKEERICKYWIIFTKFKANIASKLFSYWELQYTLVILSD